MDEFVKTYRNDALQNSLTDSEIQSLELKSFQICSPIYIIEEILIEPQFSRKADKNRVFR